MKRFFLVLLAFCFILTGCGNSTAASSWADAAVVTYSVSSYALFTSDPELISELYDCFSGLSLEMTDEEMDVMTMLSVSFSKNGSTVGQYSVDENGVFWLDGSTACWKLDEGVFDYDRVYRLYDNSRALGAGA